jgi:hypothetical protein
MNDLQLGDGWSILELVLSAGFVRCYRKRRILVWPARKLYAKVWRRWLRERKVWHKGQLVRVSVFFLWIGTNFIRWTHKCDGRTVHICLLVSLFFDRRVWGWFCAEFVTYEVCITVVRWRQCVLHYACYEKGYQFCTVKIRDYALNCLDYQTPVCSLVIRKFAKQASKIICYKRFNVKSI